MTLCSLVPTDHRDTASGFDARTAAGRRALLSRIDRFEPLPDDIACACLVEVDPHDETLEIEITEEMVNLALDAVEDEQTWPYTPDRGFVARPYRQARIIRFPGC